MIHRSPFPGAAIPDCTLTELVFRSVARRPDHPAFVDGLTGRTLSYAEWADQVRRAAAGLAARGLCRGDVLAIFSPNLPEYGIAFHAAALAGGVVTTANPLYTAGELRKQLEDCDARYVVTVPEFLDKVHEATRGLRIREIFAIGEPEPGAAGVPFTELTTSDAPAPSIRVGPDDLCALPYSSGTTGLPKGVMLTHRNLVANVEQCLVLGYTEDDRFIAFLPYFHIYGMIVVMHCALRVGATQITLPRFELTGFLQVLAAQRVTVAHIVPPVALLLANHEAVDLHDLSALREIFTAAAPISHELVERCCARLGCVAGQGYGMTEASPAITMAPPAVYAASPGNVGLCVPGAELKIAGDDGRALPPGQRGEVCARGPQVMAGYLGQPEATAAMIDPEGWLHTGDVGYADAAGRIFIVDRLKELIKYKGTQVAPAELEALLLTHPDVIDAAVIGIPDREAGELPKGFVVLRHPVSAEELKEFVARQVAPFKKLRLLEVVDAIPKSPSGKILRRLLRDRPPR